MIQYTKTVDVLLQGQTIGTYSSTVTRELPHKTFANSFIIICIVRQERMFLNITVKTDKTPKVQYVVRKNYFSHALDIHKMYSTWTHRKLKIVKTNARDNLI
jgi:hypothetical protein